LLQIRAAHHLTLAHGVPSFFGTFEFFKSYVMWSSTASILSALARGVSVAIDEYKIQSTSANSAIVESIVLGSTATTRTVLNAKQVNNRQNPDACVELSLLHQRKGIG